MGADQAGYNGYKVITVASGTTFTFTCASDDVTPATGTMTCREAIATVAVNGTLDVSADIRNIDIGVLTLGPGGIVKVNRASPSHLNYGSLVLSNASRIQVSS